ncbi:MAG: YoaK family protein [Nibricoccus sp.]
MLKKEIPLWILVGGFSLALIGGCINAIGLLGVFHQAVSHMSGTVTMLGLDLASRDTDLVLRTLSVVASFFFGALLSGCIIRQSTLKAGRRYGVVLAIESVLLFAAAHLLRLDLRAGDYFAAMACGLQNAMATSYSGAVIRTTHVTGMITDLGIACGHLLRGQAVEWRRFQLYGVLLTGFLSGAYFGSLGYSKIGYSTLLFPATLAGCTGLGYAIFKQIERQQHRRAEESFLKDLPNAPLRHSSHIPQNRISGE